MALYFLGHLRSAKSAGSATVQRLDTDAECFGNFACETEFTRATFAHSLVSGGHSIVLRALAEQEESSIRINPKRLHQTPNDGRHRPQARQRQDESCKECHGRECTPPANTHAVSIGVFPRRVARSETTSALMGVIGVLFVAGLSGRRTLLGRFRRRLSTARRPLCQYE